VNDTPVNLSLLKELGTKLIDIHSQHETLNLSEMAFQLNVIDGYAKHAEILENYKTTFADYKKLFTKVKELKELANQSKADLDYFQFQFNQIDEAKLSDDEQQTLENELQLLSHAEEIKRNLVNAYSALSGDGNSAVSLTKDAINATNQIKKYFAKAEELHQRIESVYIELKDITAEIENESEKIEFDPNRIQTINKRLDLIYSLEQKHRVSSVNELIEIRTSLEQKIGQISSFDEQLDAIEKQLSQKEQELNNLAKKLTVNRLQAISPVQKQIVELLTMLGMPNARFSAVLEPLQEYSAKGKDRIQFLFSANKNSEPQNIAKIASGGELSRLMLAIKSIVSQSIALPTIVFDEIDAGVSGEIADKMGNIIKKMSTKMQVINITHLPQIASKGDAHYLVYKEEKTHSTNTLIRKLTNDERINEIAKMLSGENLTQAAINNAVELLRANK